MSGVHIRGLTRAFGERMVLDGLDLDLQPGSFTALLGQSGSGKTTLLRTLSGLDAATGAYVEVPRPTAVVFQEPRLFPWLTVEANAGFGPRLAGQGDAARAGGAVAAYDRAMGISRSLSL